MEAAALNADEHLWKPRQCFVGLGLFGRAHLFHHVQYRSMGSEPRGFFPFGFGDIGSGRVGSWLSLFWLSPWSTRGKVMLSVV